MLNETVFAFALPEGSTFNMFFISRHFESTLPVYSAVHSAIMYPFSMIIYFLGFSAAAYVIFLLGKVFKKLVDTAKDKKQTA